MSLDRMLSVLLPQPGDDLRSWAQSLVAQLQFLLQEQANNTEMLSSAPATAPLYQDDGKTLVITEIGEYKLADGTVIVDADGLHVKDAVGFDVIDGPTIRIDTQHLVDAAVETAKLAAGAVTNTIIADNSISTPKLQANSVVAGKIAANAIVAGDGVIANAAIVDAQIANLNAAKINAGDIAAARMSTNIVTALEGKFATLSALAASLGVVSIQSGGALLTQGVTNYSTGTGFWMGETGGVYKMRIGNPSGSRLDWDGSALRIYDVNNRVALESGIPLTVDTRNDNQPASYYAVGTTTEFKFRTAVGAPGTATFGVMSTQKPWSDSSGGSATQTFKSADGEWKRTAPAGSTSVADWTAWSPIVDRQITASNVGTFIANATIGTAQIIDANITTAKIADANITTAKIADAQITAAKIADATITTAKIGTAQIDTLRIAGNAVTIPVSAYTAAGFTLSTTFSTFQSATINPDGGTVVCLVTVEGYLANAATPSLIDFRLLAPSGAVLITAQVEPSGTVGAGTTVAFSCSSTESGTYSAQARQVTSGPTMRVRERSLVLLATKR